MRRASRPSTSDRGAILVIVLVVVIVLGAVAVAVAKYATSNLRYGQVVEARADRLAASQAAMDDAIEQLELKRAFSLCATEAGVSGVTHDFPEPINDSTVTVTCRLANSSVSDNEGFALVVTGEGVNSGTEFLEFDNGGTPEITGPVFVQDPRRIDFRRPTTIREGDLWYQDTSATQTLEGGDPCDVDRGGASTEFDRVTFTTPIDQLAFLPAGLRGMYCVNRSWDELFAPPPIDILPTAPPASYNPGDPDGDGCTVFEPGRYTSQPVLGSHNYFKSGVYHFVNVGRIVFGVKQVATFGNTVAIGFPAIENDECDYYRTRDDSADGAVIYTSGDTRFRAISNESGMEVSGRRIGDSVVAMHVLSTSLDVDTRPLVRSENGNKREFTFNGQVWAPDSWIDFQTIPTNKNAMLRGGAVVARLTGELSASADDFKIEVSTVAASTQLRLDSVAVDDMGSTTVRVIADYRPSNGDIAVQSRRVIWE